MFELENLIQSPTPLVRWELPLFKQKKVAVFVKRDDLTHPYVMGNKWRKLKGNLQQAIQSGYTGIATFGGAYSNHIYASAAAANYAGLKAIGIIRGDELHPKSSPTLQFAQQMGMELHFVSREMYRQKQFDTHLHDSFFLIPEGGTNEHAFSGVTEMVAEIEKVCMPDFYVCAAGTGGTSAGILLATDQKVIAVSVLKGGFMQKEIRQWVPVNKWNQLYIWDDFHGGGYARVSPELRAFVQFHNQNESFQIEPIYTGKMVAAFLQQVENAYFPPGSTIVLIHTGGLQTFPALI
ncbi:MAG: 1-aminocyclopropane-1-carboxylate deaminase/D-cysteine desulfhydrase [Spirosomataceae bacterium]